MTTMQIGTQYSTGKSRANIEQALRATGLDLDALQPGDLWMLEDFHTLGRIATNQLADLAQVTKRDRVLDAGSGIGGTARFLAHQYDCIVTALDLTEEYCDTARWLDQLVGLQDKISVRQGDVTNLPFDDRSFDVVFSQHVQMNVRDKAQLYTQARRVLDANGRLALWDVTAGNGHLDYPLPWADGPERSYLVSADKLRATIEGAGFTAAVWNDLTESSAQFMESLLSAPRGPLGLHTFVENFAEKADNFTRALSNGNLRVVQAVFRAQR